jgi:glutamyl-tRNA reductase
MMLLAVGVHHRTASVAWRERLALSREGWPAFLQALAEQFQCEVAAINTCNRMEVYLGCLFGEVTLPPAEEVVRNLAFLQGVEAAELQTAVFSLQDSDALRHLFRVTASLESIVLGEAQIAGQVKESYELAQQAGTVGPVLHAVFQHTRVVAKRIRTETGLTQGKISVSSLAVDYLRQVFDHFGDKTVLVIGAGKMGELTLRQLQQLQPKKILITNRSPAKAKEVACRCGGDPWAWDALDEAMARADIILSTTGAPQPIVSLERFTKVAYHRAGRPVAIIDIAVPRDFDPRISDLDEVDILVNVDDFQQIRDRVLAQRLKCVPVAEEIVAAELDKFQKEWARRWTAPTIARLHEGWNLIRQDVQQQCLGKLNGKLTKEDQAVIEGAFKLLQNKLLHAPIAVLQEEAKAGRGRGLMEALRKLFRLHDRED